MALWNYAFTCTCDAPTFCECDDDDLTLDEQIRLAEDDLRDTREILADDEKELAKLRERKAKEDAAKVETAGQLLAGDFIQPSPRWGAALDGMSFFQQSEGAMQSEVDLRNKIIREALAKRVDAAISLAKAEQREADAKIADERRGKRVTEYCYDCCLDIATSIRNAK